MLNKVILVGRLTADPQMRTTPSGVSNCRFSVAVDRPFVSKQSGQREADFINCVAWRQTADFIGRFFTKGSVIIVDGELRNNNYTDNQGVKHYAMDVMVNNASFAGSKAETGGSNSNGFNPNNGYGGNNYNGGYGNGSYNGGNYGNNNNYSGGNSYGNAAPQPDNNVPPQQPTQNSNGGSGNSDNGSNDNNSGIDLGDLGDFEEIISDGEVPF